MSYDRAYKQTYRDYYFIYLKYVFLLEVDNYLSDFFLKSLV